MANIPQELRDLPLEHIVGSPLVAAIKAQALAADTTVDFIKEVGLKPRAEEDDELFPSDETSGEDEAGLDARIVSFKFDRLLESQTTNEDGTRTTRFQVIPSQLAVPLLSIVPIPYIRISDMSINFEFHIKDIDTSESTTKRDISATASGGNWFFKASVKGSYANTNVNKRETDRRTTLKLTANAVQDEIPEGLGRVLDILHDQVKAVPVSAPQDVTEPITQPG